MNETGPLSYTTHNKLTQNGLKTWMYAAYYSAIKKNEILPFVDNMDGPRGYYTKWNKSDRERKILYDFTYMWNVEKKPNE